MTEDISSPGRRPSGWAAPFQILAEAEVPRRALALWIAMTILASAQVLVLPLVVKEAADRVVETSEVRHIFGLAVLLLAVQLLHGAASYVQAVTLASVGEHVARRLRQRLFDAYLQAPLSVFVSSSSGALASRISHDVTLLQLGATTHLPAAISGGLVTLVAVVALLLVSPELAIVGFVFIPVVVILTVASSGPLGAANRVSLTQLGKTLAAAVEVLTVEGATAVRLFRREGAERARFKVIQDELYAANVRRARVGGISAAVAQTVAGLAVAGVILAGVWLLSRGRVTIGELVAFLLLLEQAYSPAGEAATALGQLRGTYPAVIRYNEAIAVATGAPHPVSTSSSGRPSSPPAPDDVVLEAKSLTVHLGVQPGLDGPWAELADPQPPPAEHRTVIEDVSFEVRRGEFIGVVGPSGAGKTTLALTLAGLLWPSSGEVLICGERLVGPDPRVALVPQHSHLFNESVAYNLRYADPDADDDEIELIARLAQIHDVVMALPDGYDTVLGQQGHRLSGGERQRLSIARALLRRPKVIIFDEATGNLDPASEGRLHAALKAVLDARDITLVAITHRLATVRSADRILLIADGHLRAAGTHQELTSEALYRSLLQTVGDS